MYPLRFQPIFRRYLWGGHRLERDLGKQSGPESCAESWEIVDRDQANSVVLGGKLAGRTLNQLVSEFGGSLLGPGVYQQIHQAHLPENLKGRFPLLLKFLDANQTLSVQVHPDDGAASLLDPPDLGKTEAWYVMDAQPGSKMYCGLKANVDRVELQAAIESKQTDQTLHTIYPVAGDCIFVPAGMVHAIGEGLLIAEIQQCSDTTYRLFDWNRLDANGKPRDIHIDQGLDVIDYELGPTDRQSPKPLPDSRAEQLVQCKKFQIHRWKLDNESVEIPTFDAFSLLMVTQGQLELKDDPLGQPLLRGQTALIPACCESFRITCGQSCEFLRITA